MVCGGRSRGFVSRADFDPVAGSAGCATVFVSEADFDPVAGSAGCATVFVSEADFDPVAGSAGCATVFVGCGPPAFILVPVLSPRLDGCSEVA
jgi:hypothetical protein